MSKTTTTKYAVARGNAVVSDLYDTPELATQQNAHLGDIMRSASLEPDTHVVSVEVTTEIGRPKAWTPEAPQPETEPADTPAEA